MNEQTKIIDIVDARAGDFRERKLNEAVAQYDPFKFLEVEGIGGRRVRRSLKEALVQQPDAGNMLRDGIRFIAFTEYNALAVTYPMFARVENSDRPEEEYLRDAAIGRLERTKSGDNTPHIVSGFEGGVIIQNFKYDGIVDVTGDDILYDRLGKIRQTAEILGRSAKMTEEAEMYSTITTSGNFTRSNTTGDNDIQANYQASAQLTHTNFELALATIQTAKDRKSGSYLGLAADTIIAGPLMEYPIKKLLNSGNLNFGGDDETERGDLNVYRGLLNKIVISPYFSTSYDWALCDSRARGLMFQRVQSFNVYQSTPTADNNAWLERDVIEFLVRGRFGVGFADDRPWFYAVSSSRPTT